MDTQGRDYVRENMPKMGFGTYQLNNEDELYDALDSALSNDYRLIDCAQLYGTEEMIGNILNELLPKYKLKREDIFLTSKLSPISHGEELTEEAIELCLDDLQTDYLDLFLVHWPGVCKMPGTYKFNPILRIESYKVMERYYKSGELRSIGVSNFNVAHLSSLLPECSVLPALNQIEYHPHYHPTTIVDYCREKGIEVQAYSCMGNSEYKDELFNDGQIIDLAEKYKVPVPTFLLSWTQSQGIPVLTRSTNPAHIRENQKTINILPEDIKTLLNNGKEHKVCWDSDYIL